MNTEIITSDLIDRIFFLIESESEFKRTSIWHEIQDDANFIYLRIPIEEVNEKHTATFRHLANLLDRTVPGREDDCSWMLSFIMNGETIDTYFGGNLNSPKMGFPEDVPV